MHQRVSCRLQRILDDYFREVDPEGEIFGAPLDVTLTDYTVVQPDLLYVSGEQKELLKEFTEISGEEINPEHKNFWDKIKKFFK